MHLFSCQIIRNKITLIKYSIKSPTAWKVVESLIFPSSVFFNMINPAESVLEAERKSTTARQILSNNIEDNVEAANQLLMEQRATRSCKRSEAGVSTAVAKRAKVFNDSVTEFCFCMIGRADIEESKSNVAMNAWLPQAS
ncbi:hypothetical protein EDC94DRAFT_621224 [Helicostylum pulchrum]|nr:hypothetical protein EDC94DRAFT_621224 [Helicostylum pulchrum]